MPGRSAIFSKTEIDMARRVSGIGQLGSATCSINPQMVGGIAIVCIPAHARKRTNTQKK